MSYPTREKRLEDLQASAEHLIPELENMAIALQTLSIQYLPVRRAVGLLKFVSEITGELLDECNCKDDTSIQ